MVLDESKRISNCETLHQENHFPSKFWYRDTKTLWYHETITAFTIFLGFSMFTTLKQVEILQSSLQHSTASKKKHMQGEKKMNFFINFEFPKTTVEKGYFVHRRKRTS